MTGHTYFRGFPLLGVGTPFQCFLVVIAVVTTSRLGFRRVLFCHLVFFVTTVTLSRSMSFELLFL